MIDILFLIFFIRVNGTLTQPFMLFSVKVPKGFGFYPHINQLWSFLFGVLRVLSPTVQKRASRLIRHTDFIVL